ncbi:IS4 family transposase [Candidatus Peregrinibacteria bacterium]|nr:IS4 family transposase [Candidatus Peregrinibacteria bacterium]
MYENIGDIDSNDSDWAYLINFLPDDWEQMSYNTGALKRCRNFPDAQSLLRTLLIHLVDGCSLRETAVRAKIGNISNVSDVALLKRLNLSGEWFRCMAEKLMSNTIDKKAISLFPMDFKVRLVDATCISKPGSAGTDWRIHYSIDLPSLFCHDLKVSDHTVGETFKNFNIEKSFVYIGDRGYCHRAGIYHVVANDSNVIVRINQTTLPLLHDKCNKSFNLLRHLRSLKPNNIGDWPVRFEYNNEWVRGRVCAIGKTKIATEIARNKIIAERKRKQKEIIQETLEYAGYIIVFTTIPIVYLGAATILEAYRGRWQIELVFKRLKSLLELGQLPKKDPPGAKSWLYGKIFCALLIESLISSGERFFPWGYPIKTEAN